MTEKTRENLEKRIEFLLLTSNISTVAKSKAKQMVDLVQQELCHEELTITYPPIKKEEPVDYSTMTFTKGGEPMSEKETRILRHALSTKNFGSQRTDESCGLSKWLYDTFQEISMSQFHSIKDQEMIPFENLMKPNQELYLKFAHAIINKFKKTDTQ